MLICQKRLSRADKDENKYKFRTEFRDNILIYQPQQKQSDAGLEFSL